MPIRATATLRAKLERNLSTYAVAAGAAGIGLLAVPSVAEAEVVYTPTHINVLAAPIDLNNDGIPDFHASLYYECAGGGCGADLFASALSAGGGIQVGKRGPNMAAARKTGGKIGPQKQFLPRHAFMAEARTSLGSFFTSGSWVNVKSRYLGLNFKIGDQTHYGWARLTVRVSYDGFSK